MQTGHRVTGLEAHDVGMTTPTQDHTTSLRSSLPSSLPLGDTVDPAFALATARAHVEQVDPTALGPGDPRLAFARAVATARPIVAGVRPDQMTLPTPCDEFDVRTLLGHLQCVLERIAVVGRDGDAGSVPLVREGVADDGWTAVWDEAAHDVQAAWSDPVELTKMKTLPFATLPAPVALAIYTSEVTVHTWDLAHATGQQPAWDEAVVGGALHGMRMALPAVPRGGELPFGDVVEVAADAPLIDQLVAWVGRRP